MTYSITPALQMSIFVASSMCRLEMISGAAQQRAQAHEGDNASLGAHQAHARVQVSS